VRKGKLARPAIGGTSGLVPVSMITIGAVYSSPPATSVSRIMAPAKAAFYLDVLDYFFDDDDLHFRALIVPNKDELRHADFGQSHDEWYYKMYFDMLKVLFEPHAEYRTYLDIKDTRSAAKVAKLHDVLCNNMYDFERRIIARVQTVRSHEVEQLQLADLLIGAVVYVGDGKDAETLERFWKRLSRAPTGSKRL